jgi:hypothetical protein
MAFYFFSLCVVFRGILGGINYWIDFNPALVSDPFLLVILIICSYIFGRLLIEQGTHKRDIIMEHALRVFYVIWRKRTLELEMGLKKAQHEKYLK